MRIYFSGSKGMTDTPEVLVPKLNPFVMLTFNDLYGRDPGAMIRLKAFLKQKRQNENQSRRPVKQTKLG